MEVSTSNNDSCSKYTHDDLQKAVTSVSNGEMSIRQAGKKYGIPRSTLFSKVKGNTTNKCRSGPRPALTPKEENTIVDWAIECSKRGQPRTPTDIRFAAKAILDRFPRPTVFKNNFPSYNWYKRFLKRNPKIKPRKPEALSSSSANVTQADLRGWWNQIDRYFWKHHLLPIMSDPRRVGNTDETMYEFNPKPGKVLVEKHSKNSYMSQLSGNKTGCTVLHTVLADGTYLDPFLIFPYKRLPENIKNVVSGLEGIDYNYNASGWMTEDNFMYYLEHVFVKGMKQRNVEFPVVLFLDNHSSHVSFKISELADKLGVILITLYPNSTYISQPLDCAVFRGLKAQWSNLLIKKRGINGNFKVTMLNFPELLLELLKTSHNAEAVKNGFKVCGIYEWNVDNIDFSKLLSSKSKKKIQKSEVLVESQVNSNSNAVDGPPDLELSVPIDLEENDASDVISDVNNVVEMNSFENVLIENDDSLGVPSVSNISNNCARVQSPSIEYIDLMENSYTFYDDLRLETSANIQKTYHSENFDNYSDNAGSVSRLDIQEDFEDNTLEIESLPRSPVFEFHETHDTTTQDQPLDLTVNNSLRDDSIVNDQSTAASQNESIPTSSNRLPEPIAATIDRNAVFTELKDIYGPVKFKQFNNNEYEPKDIHEDILMRIITQYRPITQPRDVLLLPPATKRLGIRNNRKQPFVVSSNEFRQFRSKIEKEKYEKKRKENEDKENKKNERDRLKQQKAIEDLEKARKNIMAKAEKQLETAKRKAEEKLVKTKKIKPNV